MILQPLQRESERCKHCRMTGSTNIHDFIWRLQRSISARDAEPNTAAAAAISEQFFRWTLLCEFAAVLNQRVFFFCSKLFKYNCAACP